MDKRLQLPERHDMSSSAALLARLQAYDREIEAWTFEASPIEKDIVAKIDAIAPTLVTHMTFFPWLLPWIPAPRQCHQNVMEFIDRHPVKDKFFPVHGWLPLGDHYALHSVVGAENDMFCVTPQSHDLNAVWFIPDPDITVQVVGRCLMYRWRGRRFDHNVVRTDPDGTIAKWRNFHDLIHSGMAGDDALAAARLSN